MGDGETIPSFKSSFDKVQGQPIKLPVKSEEGLSSLMYVAQNISTDPDKYVPVPENGKAITVSQEAIDTEAKRIVEKEDLKSIYSRVNHDLQRINYFPPEMQKKIRNAADNMTSRITDLANRRAKYNLTRDSSVFNKYLPYRNSIKDDKAKLEKYEEMVNLIMEKTDIRFARDVEFEGEFDKHPKADKSTYYMVAALIAEGLHNRSDLVEKVLVRKKNFKVRIDSDRLGNSGTYSVHNIVELSKNNLWYNRVFESLRENTVFHEMIHAIDGELSGNDPCYFSDGTLIEMKEIKNGKGESLLDRFLRVREKLHALNDYKKLSANERSKKITEKKIESKTGLPSYMFSGDGTKEFIAEGSRIFIDNPEIFFAEGEHPDAKELKQELYDVFKQFFKFDPLNEIKN